MRVQKLLENYSCSKMKVGVLGSHSALDVCRGAKDEGLSTLVVCEAGREKVYHDYYRSHGTSGCVDNILILQKFDQLLDPEIIRELQRQQVIFVPHRSFEVYLHSDYAAIEQTFKVPMFGNRNLLKIEERGTKPNQYDLLEAANIRYPHQFTDPHDIDRLCLVKVLEKERNFERAFFLTGSYADYKKKVEDKIQQGMFTAEQINKAVIEEFVLGVQVNFNFFYSPLSGKLELLGTDTRRQTNIEGFLRVPSDLQREVSSGANITYEESGHIAVTILESMLEQVFALGERFVAAAHKLYPPGIIGPFALQSFIIPGPPKKDIVVIDVSPRMPGSPGISATPYSAYLHGSPVSAGRRIAIEIRQAAEQSRLEEILT